MPSPAVITEPEVEQEIFESLPDPDLTENAREVLKRRYLIRDEDGNPTETPKDMFWRVARTIASVDGDYGATEDEVMDTAVQFYRMMSQGYWLPNSPTLTGAGRELGMLSACFVLPISDCISNDEDGIFDTVTNAGLIWQAGGGTGYSFSRLRPKGAMVKSTTGVASGPVSFMQIYNTAVDTMKQGGHRRGAQMAILRVDHPDILDFIDCKSDTSELTNFNVSVAVTDEFMKAVESGEPYNLYDPRDGSLVGTLDAQEVFDRIVDRAHATGEPGLFFVDEANRWNEVPKLGDIEATNPCGEIPMPPYSACNLGSLNLSKFVDEQTKTIKWGELQKYARRGAHFLDNVIDANNYPIEKIRERSDKERRIGAGVMGWADMLIKMGIPYDSEDARELAIHVADTFFESTVQESERLAEERGVFPEWEDSIWGPDDDRRPTRKVRNASLTTVAPTGTISIIAGCSGGIEPIYAVGFMRNQAGTKMPDIHRDFDHDYVHEEAPSRWREILIDSGHLDHDWIHPNAKRVFRTSSDVSPEDHIRMQAAWQPYITQAISKTINFPKDATAEDVREGYLLAHDLGCKGVTVYRDGSRPGQVLSTGKTNEKEEKTRASTNGNRPQRPDVLSGETRRIESPVGRMYVTVNSDGAGDPYEVFVSVGKAGGSALAHSEAIGRLLSVALQHGVPLATLHKQLAGISSDQTIGFGPNKVRSGPDAVAQVLKRYLDDHEAIDDTGMDIATCPECSSSLSHEEGCAKCHSCGYSQCT